jgi:hypothetical protein
MDRPLRRALAMVLVGALIALEAFPAVAEAHGPVAPIATSYLARLSAVPAGLDAKVVDGDLRLWLRVVPSLTVVVLDYRGAPYLRFSRLGVDVNQASAMYYLNQTPAETPPSNLGPTTRPQWVRVSSGHDYGWHDGRLNALAATALAPGTEYVGRWTIPVRIDGRLSAISGGLWHANDPSIVWFWPILVLLGCVLAARRLRRPELDTRVGRVLSVAALVAIAVGGVGQQLHGRPTVSIGQYIGLGLILALAAWGLFRVVVRRPGYFSFLVIAVVAVWEGIQLVPTLLNGFVLAAVPAFAARTAAVVCLGSAAGLLSLVTRVADRAEAASAIGGEPTSGPDDEDYGWDRSDEPWLGQA